MLRVNKPTASWILVAIWIAFIYATIPIARYIQGVIVGYLPRAVFLWIAILFAVWLIFIALPQIFHKETKGILAKLIILLLCIAAFAAGAYYLKDNPEQAFHFVQYGMLAILVFKAIQTNINDLSVYGVTLLICSITGTVDEIIQWITPGRYFDYADIILNATSALIVAIAIAGVFRPRNIITSFNYRGIYWVFALGGVQFALLIFCLVSI